MARQYKDTETRRREVAEATLRTISEDGVGGFTTRAVAQRVGIGDGTLFRHFGSKQEILLEAMCVLEIDVLQSLVSTGNPLEDLKSFFYQRAVFVGEKDAVGALVFSSELVHLVGAEGNKKIRFWREKSMSYLRTQISSLQNEGKTTTDLDVVQMCMFVQGLLLTFVLERTFNKTGTRKQLDQRIDKAWDALCTVLFNR